MRPPLGPASEIQDPLDRQGSMLLWVAAAGRQALLLEGAARPTPLAAQRRHHRLVMAASCWEVERVEGELPLLVQRGSEWCRRQMQDCWRWRVQIACPRSASRRQQLAPRQPRQRLLLLCRECRSQGRGARREGWSQRRSWLLQLTAPRCRWVWQGRDRLHCREERERPEWFQEQAGSRQELGQQGPPQRRKHPGLGWGQRQRQSLMRQRLTRRAARGRLRGTGPLAPPLPPLPLRRAVRLRVTVAWARL